MTFKTSEFKESKAQEQEAFVFYSPHFKETFVQATYALGELCGLSLPRDSSDKRQLTSGLIAVAVLLLTCRDHLVFQQVYESGLYQRIMAKKPLHRLPTIVQVKALVTALRPQWADLTTKEQGALDTIENLTDSALDIEVLKAFRDQVVSTGLISEASSAVSEKENLFPVQLFDLFQLVKDAKHGWQALLDTMRKTQDK